ncbi:hypothetical protein PM082_000904 [Marasmius tenuissimus]|nr:hypothetical protein PM082_000904 [Marasmius tenuissimus]
MDFERAFPEAITGRTAGFSGTIWQVGSNVHTLASKVQTLTNSMVHGGEHSLFCADDLLSSLLFGEKHETQAYHLGRHLLDSLVSPRVFPWPYTRPRSNLEGGTPGSTDARERPLQSQYRLVEPLQVQSHDYGRRYVQGTMQTAQCTHGNSCIFIAL